MLAAVVQTTTWLGGVRQTKKVKTTDLFFSGVDGVEAAGERVIEETTMLYAHCYVTHIQSAPRRRELVA